MSQPPAPVESAISTPVTAAPIETPTPVRPSEAVTAPYQEESSIVVNPPSAPPKAVPSVVPSGKTHVVQPGENLFRISLNNGLKYQDVAAWNQLPDFNIQVGQVLRLTPPDGSSVTIAPSPANTTAGGSSTSTKAYPKALKLPYSEDAAKTLAGRSEGSGTSVATVTPPPVKPAEPAKVQPPPVTPVDTPPTNAVGGDNIAWLWPTEGKMTRAYSDSNKGIDIAGRSGQPVMAAGDGKVVYSGTGLRGYGKLVIIKHNKTFLSAYAHNSQLLVKEGQSVKRGQKIAEMGNTDADRVKLHFEVRRFGKPVDPMQYFQNKP